MKDYDHVVIWLDYFNKTLSRQKGRKVAKEKENNQKKHDSFDLYKLELIGLSS